MLDSKLNLSTKFVKTNWVEMNYDARGAYIANSQTESKTSMLKSSLCDYSDAYVIASGTI